jgi:hypothetical protein
LFGFFWVFLFKNFFCLIFLQNLFIHNFSVLILCTDFH